MRANTVHYAADSRKKSSGLAKFALSGPIAPDIRMSSSSGSEGTSWQRGLKVGEVPDCQYKKRTIV